MIKLNEVKLIFKEGNTGFNTLNLEFNRGDITMIIGPNGSGKSSILNSIGNLTKYEGEILLDDTNIKKIKNNSFRKRVGMVFQNPNNQIIFNKVYDDLEFTLRNLKIEDCDKIIKEALEEVSMLDKIDSNPYLLSLGERQRIALANTLATHPEYLLLDEITSMIDYQGKSDIYNILNKLKKENIGIIMSTNIMDELIYADKIVILNMNHEVKKVLTKEELLNNPNILQEYGFPVPFMFRVINKIGYKKLKELDIEEILKHVN